MRRQRDWPGILVLIFAAILALFILLMQQGH